MFTTGHWPIGVLDPLTCLKIPVFLPFFLSLVTRAGRSLGACWLRTDTTVRQPIGPDRSLDAP